MTPSVKTIEKYFPGKGKEIRNLLDGTRDPKEYPAVRAWVSKCYNEPNRVEQILCAVDSVLGTHGVECIFKRGGIRPLLDYCNTGETYNATIAYRHDTCNFVITSWGDFVETYERRHGRLD